MPKSTETSPPAAPRVAAEPAAFDAAVARIESARTQLRELANTLGETLTLLKAAEREQRTAQREVQSVRATLRGLQKVQL